MIKSGFIKYHIKIGNSMKMWTRFMWLMIGTDEYYDEPLGSTESRELLVTS
jgi:hypothetical protein